MPQWLNYRETDVPRLKDGRVNLSAPVRHTADGKFDLTGMWMHEPTPTAEYGRLFGIAEDRLRALPPQ